MRRNFLKFFSFIVSLPLFVNVLGDNLIGLGKWRFINKTVSGQTVPISLFILFLFIGFLFILFLVRGHIAIPHIPYRLTIIKLISCFIFLNILAFMVGQIIEFNLKAIFFLLQTIIPVFAILVTAFFVRNRLDIEVVLQYFTFGILTGVLGVIIINFLNFKFDIFSQAWVDNYGSIGIYQLKSYVPNIFATFIPVMFGLVFISRSLVKKFVFTLGIPITLFTIIRLPSMTAILIAIFGLFIFGVGAFYFGVLKVQLLRILFFIIIPLLLAIHFYSPLRNSFLLPINRYFGYEKGVKHRLDKFITDGSVIMSSPFIGKAYIVNYGSDLPGVMEKRVAKPHNQFLDIGLRSGLPTLFIFILMIFMPVMVCIKGLFFASNQQDKIIGLSLVSSLLFSVSFHSMVLIPYIQPYSGIILYSLSGLAFGYYRMIIYKGVI